MKTIIILASRQYHLSPIIDIRDIPPEIRKKAKFILVVNKDLYNTAKNEFKTYYEEIIPTEMLPMNNKFELGYDLESLKKIFVYIDKNYKNLEFIIQDEFNIGKIEPILEDMKIRPWMNKTANICTNKVIMKDLMREKGIRVPNFRILNDLDTYEELIKEFGEPFIVKPLSSAASIGVEKISNASEYSKFLLNKTAISGHYEVEEFLSGDLYHIESVKLGDNITATISKYTFPQAEAKNGKIVGSIPILSTHRLFKVLSAFNKSVLKVLDNNGCFHLEVFIKDDKPVFLEIAWRQSGPPVNNNFTGIFGASQTIFYICLLIENKIVNFSRSNFNLEYWVPKSNGIYNGISLPKLSGTVKEITHISEIGKSQNSAYSYSDIAGKFILEYNDLDESYNHIENDFNLIKSHNFKA